MNPLGIFFFIYGLALMSDEKNSGIGTVFFIIGLLLMFNNGSGRRRRY